MEDQQQQKKSFICDAAKVWNKAPEKIRTSKTLTTAKKVWGTPWSRGRTSDSQLGDPGSIPFQFLLRGSSAEAICSPGSSPGQIFDL